MISEKTRLCLQHAMAKLPFVTWDRWAGEGQWAQSFGWIPRGDGRHDFVVLESDGTSIGNTTSSAEYSARISEILHGPSRTHNHCRRIEDDFPALTNVVKLDRTGG